MTWCSKPWNDSPRSGELTIHACNIARHLEKYPEAIRYADRAIVHDRTGICGRNV